MADASPQRSLKRRLDRIYAWYTVGFVAFIALLAMLERMGLSKSSIGFTFLFATVAVYAGIGVLSRTTDANEYYVAGRRVPAIYNGMAVGADWMSAATFIGMAGTLYLTGYGGLAFVLGWTGGFCLVALLLAPYLRQFGQFTVPDFLGARYGSNSVRLLAAFATVLCSFIYVVAQLYGIGLITTRLSGLTFEIGVFVGLGGVLVCSFLGGMRAVTWTQVAQYIILILAYLVPVVWLSVKQTGSPLPQAVYGAQVQQIGELEQRLIADPRELEVIELLQRRAQALADKLAHVPESLASERQEAQRLVARLKAEDAALAQIQAAEKRLAQMPRTADEARELWQRQKAADEARARPLGGMPPHAQPFAGDPQGSEAERRSFDDSRRNFLALVFCLMLGTAGLPHILARFYTTPSVKEARESVGWSMLFIGLLYITAPALAVMVKFEVFSHLVGTPFGQLPGWIAEWARVDPGLLSVSDINGDRILQLGELQISGDIVMLATPELAGLPFVVSGMVAAGGLAAALSTADGLLLTISAALSHDVYYRSINPSASTATRVTISKSLLMLTALAAAAVAAQKPADILFLVAAAFSFAASGLFPVLVTAVFWRRANRWGAVAGILVGLGVTGYYMARTQPWLRSVLGVTGAPELWWSIQPISAGVFGVPASFLTIVIVSLLTPPPRAKEAAMADGLRDPAEA